MFWSLVTQEFIVNMRRKRNEGDQSYQKGRPSRIVREGEGMSESDL